MFHHSGQKCVLEQRFGFGEKGSIFEHVAVAFLVVLFAVFEVLDGGLGSVEARCLLDGVGVHAPVDGTDFGLATHLAYAGFEQVDGVAVGLAHGLEIARDWLAGEFVGGGLIGCDSGTFAE